MKFNQVDYPSKVVEDDRDTIYIDTEILKHTTKSYKEIIQCRYSYSPQVNKHLNANSYKIWTLSFITKDHKLFKKIENRKILNNIHRKFLYMWAFLNSNELFKKPKANKDGEIFLYNDYSIFWNHSRWLLGREDIHRYKKPLSYYNPIENILFINAIICNILFFIKTYKPEYLVLEVPNIGHNNDLFNFINKIYKKLNYQYSLYHTKIHFIN